MPVYPYAINGGGQDLPSSGKEVIKKGRTMVRPFLV